MKSERKFKNTLRQMTMKTKPYKIYEMEKSSPKREVHTSIDFPQKKKQEKNSNKQLNLPSKRIINPKSADGRK